jgi:hypothetical protein
VNLAGWHLPLGRQSGAGLSLGMRSKTSVLEHMQFKLRVHLMSRIVELWLEQRAKMKMGAFIA